MKTLMTSKRLRTWAALAALPLLAACGGHYYQVTDTASGKAYYTRDIEHEDGHARFVDKATGDKVNLSGFEVRKITEDQYKNAVRK